MAELKQIDISEALDASQFLTFILSGEEFAVPIMQVKEIIEYRNLTQVPMVPDFISGAINLRGSVVPVINLAMKFEMQPEGITRRTCVIIMEVLIDHEPTVMGVLVDKVLQVIDISDENIEAAPTLGAQIRTDFIRGMGHLDDRFVIILNVDRVLSADEIAVVGKLTGDKNSSIDSDDMD